MPWSAVFTSPERLLVTERAWPRVRIVENENVKRLHSIFSEQFLLHSEEGLMGMALDPQYGK